MNIKRRLSFVFEMAVIICCLIGILSNILNTSSVTSILSFYTMQSNVFVLTFYLLSIVISQFKSDWKKCDVYYFLKGATIMIILLTFTIYLISLYPTGFIMDANVNISSNIFSISNVFVHFITPIMVLVDYLIFDDKGHFKLNYPLLWYIFPSLYLIYVYTYSSHGGKFFGSGGSRKYAYFFLDIDKIGVGGVIKYLILISLLFIAACYILILIDNTLSKHKRRKPSNS